MDQREKLEDASVFVRIAISYPWTMVNNYFKICLCCGQKMANFFAI